VSTTIHVEHFSGHLTCVRQVENSADNVFYVRDHWIVERIGVFGDLEIFLDETPHVGEEGPVGADSTAIFVSVMLSVLIVTSRH
jgi:hypothetical protein